MPLPFVGWLRKWKPLARQVAISLIKIATGAAAAATPENELLIRCLGGAAEATTEQCFNALPPAQQQAVNDQLMPLLEKHAHLLTELQNSVAEQHLSVEALTGIVRQLLDQREDLRREFDQFAAGLTEIGQTLRRLETKLDVIDVNVLAICRRLDEMERRPKSPYWLSIHDEADVAWLRRQYDEYRTWPAQKRRELRQKQFAALLIEAGESAAASALCDDAVGLCADTAEKADLLLQKMRAELERNRLDDALAALREAVQLDPGRAPFPAHQFEPERILGIGGAGTALLCRNRYEANARVVVKCLHAEGLARKPEELFNEVPVLRRLARAQRDAVVGVHSCGFVDAGSQRGPYIVMDYFPGVSLQKHLDETQAGLALADFAALALPVARALHAAHGLGIYHRDVKPDNVLVACEVKRGAPPASAGWAVRLIDFGLAVKCDVARNSQVAPRKSMQGLAAAGTVDFAAPEQMGKRQEPIGPYSDVYGFGRFCSYALFRTTTPLNRHWRGQPEALRDLIERCIEEVPGDRHPNFAPILEVLRGLLQPPAPAKPAVVLSEHPGTPAAETVRPIKEPPRLSVTPAAATPLVLKFVRLPKGTFYMGGGGGKAGAKTEIKQDFEIAVHAVTQEQWQAIMGINPSWFSRAGGGWFSRIGGGKDKVESISDADLKQFPVEQVSWDDAQAFLKKLNEREKDSGWLYRLPTEAEWEYACRGGAASEAECSYHFYLDKPANELSSKQANFDGNYPDGNAAKGPYLKRTTKVGSYSPNKLGLYDMHGNVWEWCEDLYDRGLGRALRGGSWDGGVWFFLGSYCRATARYERAPDDRSNILGFRLARVSSSK